MRNNTLDFGDQSIITDWLIKNVLKHELPTDPRRHAPFNLDNLKNRNWLLNDLKEKNNLLYEWKNWAVSTTIWPYWNHHIMLIYTWLSEDVYHMWQIKDDDLKEYYEILSLLLAGLQDDYKEDLISWNLELIYWLNHSIFPGPWKSQSVQRPHTHVTLMDTNEKNDGLHTIKKLPLIVNETEDNKHLLALNKQNLQMIKEFESKFLNVKLQWYKESLLVSSDEYYAVDFTLPWDMKNEETLRIFEQVHSEGRKYLETVYNKDTSIISKETLKLIWEDLDKIWFSIWFYEKKWIWHLRFRFSFKNKWEDAGVLETMWHSISRNTLAPDNLPNMDRIRKNVQEILSYKTLQ